MITYDEIIRFNEKEFKSFCHRIKGNIPCEDISIYAYYLINNYSGFDSGRLNYVLRKDKGRINNPHFVFWEYILNKALNELPPYNNQIVYRMDSPSTELPFNILKIWYKKRIGDIITIPQFWSTSKDCWKNGNKYIYFKIITANKSHSRDLAPVLNPSKVEYEREVLFKSRTRFKIISIDEKNDTFELLELSEKPGNSIFIYDNLFINDKDLQPYLNLVEPDKDKLSFLDKLNCY